MSRRKIPRCQRDIERELRHSGLDWRIEYGSKHKKLYIEGQLVLVLSNGARQSNDVPRVRSFIRRAQEHADN